ncbi:MAG: Flp family type IVb pilin [Acidimicrobiia bacterium]|nr:Flp family type IVb pilin [Acidimicrobiia bacterium]
MIPNIAYRIRCSVDVIRSERGAAMVEYSLLIALIAVIAIAAIKLVGGQVSQDFSEINSKVGANT